MADVRLTATNPDDSSVVPVACNAKGELKLEEPIEVPGPPGPPGDRGEPGEDGDPFSGNFADNVTFGGSAIFDGLVSAGSGVKTNQGGDAASVGTGIFSNALDYLAITTAGKLRSYVNSEGSTDIIMSDRADATNGFRFIGALDDGTTLVICGSTQLNPPANGKTITQLTHWLASNQTSFAGKFTDLGSTQYGFKANASLFGAANNYGFHSDLSTGSVGENRYNFYAAGDAPNYFEGITEHKGGVKVTGGTAASVDTGMYVRNAGFNIVQNGIDSIALYDDKAGTKVC